MCCVQEVRWKGQEARFVGTSGRRHKLWWSGNDIGKVEILVKEEISGNVVKVRRKSDRVMVIVLTLDRETINNMCVWATKRKTR